MKYWGEDQEDAIVEFNTNDDIEDKHKVFVAIIEPAFRKLVENIYYTYNFNKILWDREQIEHEVMTHLYEKLSKFDVTKNKKSFSYFGTITKNWMIQRCNTDKNKRFIDADNQEMIMHNISINAYEENKLNRHNEEFIGEIIEDFDDWDAKDNYTRDDFAVLEIVNDILKNYERFNIYNKKQLYVYIREATDLPSRKITKSLKKIKLDYFSVKTDFIG
jgi:DNA-directed RNA polymerase specialized sigma24 family protein